MRQLRLGEGKQIEDARLQADPQGRQHRLPWLELQAKLRGCMLRVLLVAVRRVRRQKNATNGTWRQLQPPMQHHPARRRIEEVAGRYAGLDRAHGLSSSSLEGGKALLAPALPALGTLEAGRSENAHGWLRHHLVGRTSSI